MMSLLTLAVHVNNKTYSTLRGKCKLEMDMYLCFFIVGVGDPCRL